MAAVAARACSRGASQVAKRSAAKVFDGVKHCVLADLQTATDDSVGLRRAIGTAVGVGEHRIRRLAG